MLFEEIYQEREVLLNLTLGSYAAVMMFLVALMMMYLFLIYLINRKRHYKKKEFRESFGRNELVQYKEEITLDC